MSTLPFEVTCTTIVLDSRSLSGLVFGGVGWGTSASKPCGTVGVMTMKIMMSTRSTSINGTILGSDIEPLLPPTAIPMEDSFTKRYQTRTNAAPVAARRRLIGGRRRRRSGATLPTDFFSQQAKMVNASRADFVHGLDDVAVFGAGIGAHENGLVQAVGDKVLHFAGDFVELNLGAAEIEVAVTGDRDNDGVILVGILHVLGVISLGHVYGNALLQHGSDHHEDDEQHQHDVRHGNNVWGGHNRRCFGLVGHGLLLPATTGDEVVDQLHRGVVHLDVEGFDFVGEV